MPPTRTVLVTVSAALVAALTVSGCSSTPNQATVPATTTPAKEAPSAAEQPTSDSVCGLGDVQMTGGITEAPEVTWELVGTTLAPKDPAAGPGLQDDDGLRRCFARTPLGALLAAANIMASGSSPALVTPLTDRLSAPGPGRDAALADLAGRVTVGDSTIRYEIAGFTMSAYDGRNASVDVVIRASNQALLAQMIDLTWVEGDWKVALADDGQMRTPMGAVQSLAGYTAWDGAQ
ncbi:hypothetical protein [Cellulomonas denverensis]|uniref:DUF8175 domain-containing protein n=1 Tax=Cellulomonas denverensis TaxID=264297 RepID=A0A7X6R0K7_9CELL|nr:hypothetical protein [Cellulomonas denverensis]NKY24338.1 hypothetical protein [Cellulomonas denverensis]GIG26411.1 hypothetical protein Cde04nite_26550 [Cellulomonas denverensis]